MLGSHIVAYFIHLPSNDGEKTSKIFLQDNTTCQVREQRTTNRDPAASSYARSPRWAKIIMSDKELCFDSDAVKAIEIENQCIRLIFFSHGNSIPFLVIESEGEMPLKELLVVFKCAYETAQGGCIGCSFCKSSK